MYVETDKIGERGLWLCDSVELDEDFLIEEGSFFLDNLDYNIHFARRGNQIKVLGKIKTSLSLRCVRCLEEFELRVNSRFDVILFPSHLIESTNVVLDSPELEYIFYEGNKIDLTKILVEQINLSIPYNPICSSSCKGICPNCGINLNYEICQCDDSSGALNFLFDKIKR